MVVRCAPVSPYELTSQFGKAPYNSVSLSGKTLLRQLIAGQRGIRHSGYQFMGLSRWEGRAHFGATFPAHLISLP